MRRESSLQSKTWVQSVQTTGEFGLKIRIVLKFECQGRLYAVFSQFWPNETWLRSHCPTLSTRLAGCCSNMLEWSYDLLLCCFLLRLSAPSRYTSTPLLALSGLTHRFWHSVKWHHRQSNPIKYLEPITLRAISLHGLRLNFWLKDQNKLQV